MANAPALETFQCIEMAVFNLGGLTASYQVLNGASQQTDTGSIGFQYDIKILKIYNDGTNGITLSYGASGSLTNALVKQDYLPAKGTMIIDLQTNHGQSGGPGGHLTGRQGQLVYGKGTASADGINLYIIGYL